MNERKKVLSGTFVAYIILTVICLSVAAVAIPYEGTMEISTFFNDSYMIAEGTFDRVELVDRHFGSINGQEVEGALLAVLYENGTVEVDRDHYLGAFRDDVTFPFFLYVYDGIDHLRERITVEGGGILMEFIFLNVTVSITLDMIEGTKVIKDYLPFLVGIGLVFISAGFAFLVLTEERYKWVKVKG